MFKTLREYFGNNGKRQVRQLEAEAFFHGAHGINSQAGTDEVQARFDQNAAQLNHTSATAQKKQEARLDHVRSILPSAQSTLLEVRERLGDRVPPFALPCLMAAGAVTMTIAEVVLMAPALDVLSVTDPIAQAFTALGIVLISGITFHFAWESLIGDTFTPAWRFVVRLVTLFVAAALFCWGILRGLQIAYAAKLSGNPLGDFLSDHPYFSAVLYIFVTLAAPLMIAAATHYALHHLRDWKEWRSAHSSVSRLLKEQITAQRELEAEKARLQHALKQNGHECNEWKSLYRLQHERGGNHGAIQEPEWIVPVKASLAAFAASGVLFWAPWFVIGPAAGAAWLAAFLFYRKKRLSPTPQEYAELERVQFAEVSSDRPPSQVRTILPSPGAKELPR